MSIDDLIEAIESQYTADTVVLIALDLITRDSARRGYALRMIAGTGAAAIIGIDDHAHKVVDAHTEIAKSMDPNKVRRVDEELRAKEA